MKFISIFESITRAALKDCFEQNGRIIFVVKQGEIGKAIGKKGINTRKLERILKKRIKIIEFNPDLLVFVQNVVFPSKVKEIKEEEGVVIIIPPDSETRGYLIGKSASNLRNTEEVVGVLIGQNKQKLIEAELELEQKLRFQLNLNIIDDFKSKSKYIVDMLTKEGYLARNFSIIEIEKAILQRIALLALES